jgi:hypothetical protein
LVEDERTEILQAFADDPAAMQNCERGKITPFNWMKSELASKCDWKKLNGEDWSS